MSTLAWSQFIDVVHANGAKTAVLHGDERCSFAELEQLALNWAATLGSAPGERVILYSENSIPTIAAVLGIWRCGAVPVWINSAAPTEHVRLGLEETKAVCVISPKPNLSSLLSCDVYAQVDTTGVADFPVLEEAQTTIGSIVYTSGSTGRPKGVVQNASTLIDGARRVSQELGYRSDDCILCPVPFAFDYGWGQLLSTVFGGITLALPNPQNAFGLCDAITLHRPTILAGVPAVFANLFSGLSPIRDVDCSSIRLITNTGSRIPPTVLQALWEIFPNSELSLNYGLTETYRSASLPVAMAKTKPDAVGSAFPGADIVIVDINGTQCAANETGEIVHRGAGIFEGYWNDPERTALVRRPDPIDSCNGQVAVFTGDLGYLDDDGHLVVVGRRDRQIKSMGVRVSPDEIEEIIQGLGHTHEVAITSRSDENVGDLVVAFVVMRDGVDLKSLKFDLHGNLSPYMMPRVFHVMDALPRNPNEKIDYPFLQHHASKGQ